MTITVYATFDGSVFKPEEQLDLTPNQRYLVRVERPKKSGKKQKGHVLQRIVSRATDLGIFQIWLNNMIVICMELQKSRSFWPAKVSSHAAC